MTKIHFAAAEFPSNMLLACFSAVPSLILPQSALRTPAAAHRAALRCVGPDDSVDRVLDRVIERENESKAQLAAMAALSASSSAVALSSFAVAAELDAAAPVRADLDTVERVMEEEEAAGDEEEASKPAAAQRRALAD